MSDSTFKVHAMELGPMENFVYLVEDVASRRCAVVDPAWEVDTILFGPGTEMPTLRRGEDAGQFPNSREAMARYDAIILGQVAGGLLNDSDTFRLREFVTRGGGLIVIDGRFQTLRGLAAGELHLLRVDHDDVVAAIHVRREGRLVLAAKDARDLRRQAAEDQTMGIDHEPLLLDLRGLGGIGFHCRHQTRCSLQRAANERRWRGGFYGTKSRLST